MENVKILIVDDDENICQLLTLYLRKEGYHTSVCHNGKEAIEQMSANAYNAVLLDIMMPEMDGYETLRAIRESSDVPVIMLSAKGESADKISGLDCGADDYVTKPFDPQELLLRIKAILRRTQPPAVPDQPDLIVGNLLISPANYLVKVGEKRVDMPRKEIELLYYLAANPMQVFTREQLLSRVWGADYKGDTRTVDVHVKRIRERLGNGETWGINTIWGVGYQFESIG